MCRATETIARCVCAALLAASSSPLPLSNMPQFIMKSTHPEHEDYGKPGWRDDILVFCNNYTYAEKHVGVLFTYVLLIYVCRSICLCFDGASV